MENKGKHSVFVENINFTEEIRCDKIKAEHVRNRGEVQMKNRNIIVYLKASFDTISK